MRQTRNRGPFTNGHLYIIFPLSPAARTGRAFDRPADKFDTPTLIELWRTAPYLHDGSAKTLEEIWTVCNPEDKHGRTNDLTKDELNDLIEYLRTR